MRGEFTSFGMIARQTRLNYATRATRSGMRCVTLVQAIQKRRLGDFSTAERLVQHGVSPLRDLWASARTETQLSLFPRFGSFCEQENFLWRCTLRPSRIPLVYR